MLHYTQSREEEEAVIKYFDYLRPFVDLVSFIGPNPSLY